MVIRARLLEGVVLKARAMRGAAAARRKRAADIFAAKELASGWLLLGQKGRQSETELIKKFVWNWRTILGLQSRCDAVLDSASGLRY